MWRPPDALIPQGDRSVMNRVIDQLINEIYWIFRLLACIGLRGMGQIYEPRWVAGALAIHHVGHSVGLSPDPRD